MTNMTKPDISTSVPPVPTRITLSQVIAALHMLNVNVESPAEELDRAEANQAADAPVDANVDGTERATLADGRPIPVFSGMMIASPWTATSTPAAGATSAAPAAPAAPAASPVPAAAAASAASAMAPAASTESPTVAVGASSVTAPPATGGLGGGECSGGGATINGFVCASCNAYNLLCPATSTWYVVVAGRSVGVFQGWHSVQALVSGVPHASYRKYPSKEAAHQAFKDAMAEGLVVIIN